MRVLGAPSSPLSQAHPFSPFTRKRSRYDPVKSTEPVLGWWNIKTKMEGPLFMPKTSDPAQAEGERGGCGFDGGGYREKGERMFDRPKKEAAVTLYDLSSLIFSS